MKMGLFLTRIASTAFMIAISSTVFGIPWEMQRTSYLFQYHPRWRPHLLLSTDSNLASGRPTRHFWNHGRKSPWSQVSGTGADASIFSH